MIRRHAFSLLLVVLVASACSSTAPNDTVSNSGVSDVASETSEAAEETTAADVPTDGGATLDPSDVDDVIVGDAADSPLAQVYEAWPTDWTRRTVEDWSEFQPGLRGSDPRDGIPPIDAPVFESPAVAAQWLGPRDPGALVQLDGEARFYPLSILTRHEIVNDTFGDVPVAVTFCPLCNTAIAFDRRVDGQVLRLGVSGLLRNSDLVMWDDATTSLWQQVTGEGLVGEFAGAQLESVPTSIVSFSQFVEGFPDGKSLAGESGGGRSAYGSNAYERYSSSARPMLFTGETDDRLEPLARVVGVTNGDLVASYSFERARNEGVINDEVAGVPIVVFHAGDTADALDNRDISASQAIGSALAHNPVVDGQTLTFVAEGDGTFSDEQTGSTWNIFGVATDGELAGTQLEPVEHRNEFWFAWQAFFGPETLRQ